MSTLIRVGHKGADLIVPGNTPESFDAALDVGVDMIEFDVLPVDHRDPAHSRLVLAHDYLMDVASAPTREEGLDHQCDSAVDGVRLDVDLKLAGYEERVLAALAERDLLGRTMVSSMERSSLARLRELDPALKLGWSVPKARRDYTASRLYRLPAGALLAVGRELLPFRAAHDIRSGFCDAIMAFRMLVTPRLARSVREAGGELYAWTVDSATEILRLEEMGVTGVITNDPRLFTGR